MYQTDLTRYSGYQIGDFTAMAIVIFGVGLAVVYTLCELLSTNDFLKAHERKQELDAEKRAIDKKSALEKYLE